jgi:ferredoxin-NADP reductase
MKLTLRTTRQETRDIYTFVFEPERPLRWKAGQYLHYILNHPKPDARGVERYFSIASAPYENIGLFFDVHVHHRQRDINKFSATR